MSLSQSDIRFARSAVMADVPEGGGPPTSQLIPDGASNTVFPDVSEETRATGRVEIRQLHTVLRNMDTAPLLGANVIVADPPNDPNVDITLMSTKDPFATRDKITAAIEGSMVPSVEFNGYLLEDQGVNQRSIQLFQRPNAELPGVGLVYVLVYHEGQADERRQRVRVKSASGEVRTFTYSGGGDPVDYQAQVVTVELFEPLRYDFPGSPASREFARDVAKTRFRETVYSDAGMFFGSAKAAAAAVATDSELLLTTVYSRLVPNSRAEAISVDQKPASERAVRLADTPRVIDVGVTPHTQRIKIDAANVGLSYVFQLTPLPAPGTVVIHYWAMGQRYTVTDDGAGRLTGAGSGLMSYASGTVPLTLQALPDIGTIITIAWGESTGYDNRGALGAQVRAPEYAFVLDGAAADGSGSERVVPGSLTITYTSGGVLKTVTDSAGALAGDASGLIDYPSRSILLRPAFMLDPGGQFSISYDLDDTVTELLTPGSPDAGGYLAITLAQTPAAGTLSLQWAVARSVSTTGGASLNTTNASKQTGATYSIRSVPEYYEPPAAAGMGVNWPRSAS